MLFDTHAHLDSREFQNDLPGQIDNWIQQGVSGILAVATNLDSTLRCISIAERFPQVYASAGFHPNYCREATDEQWQTLKPLIDHRRVVALGETGLDKYRDDCPFDRQIDFFERHIQLSHESGLPFIVHMRDCEQEMLDVLQRSTDKGRHNGIMHSFCGSQATADRCLEWGMMISFSGMVTYPRNDELREIARTIPGDRLLIETDAPWLSPHPYRKVRPNTPALVRHTAECLAMIRHETCDAIFATTDANARRLFGLDSISGTKQDRAFSPEKSR